VRTKSVWTKTVGWAFLLAILCLPAQVFGGIFTINFDDASAVAFFASTTRLTDHYAPLGVHFQGPGGNDGGAILNQDANFGVNALSGRNFLAFNRNAHMSDDGIPKDPEKIVFDTSVSEVSIYAAGGWAVDTFTLQAYNASDVLLDTDSIATQSWGKLAVSSADDIKYVVLEERGGSYFVYDDLTVTCAAVPVPGAILLGALGLSCAGWRLRRRGTA